MNQIELKENSHSSSYLYETAKLDQNIRIELWIQLRILVSSGILLEIKRELQDPLNEADQRTFSRTFPSNQRTAR